MAASKKASAWIAGLEVPALVRLLFHEWPVFTGAAQRPPKKNWRTWLMLGGRGAGKTRAGAQWLRAMVAGDPHFCGDAAGRVALVGESYGDVRAVMVEGESGLLAVHDRRDRPQWNPSKRELVWPNGTIGKLFSASDPESLRGSQFGAAWLDAKTVWGALVSAGAALGAIVGMPLDGQTQDEIARALVQLFGAAGALLAIYGRFSATQKLF